MKVRDDDDDVDGRAPVTVGVSEDDSTTADYRASMAEGGRMWDAWKNKPHRLVYDLCSEIERREVERVFLAKLVAELREERAVLVRLVDALQAEVDELRDPTGDGFGRSL